MKQIGLIVGAAALFAASQASATTFSASGCTTGALSNDVVVGPTDGITLSISSNGPFDSMVYCANDGWSVGRTNNTGNNQPDWVQTNEELIFSFTPGPVKLLSSLQVFRENGGDDPKRLSNYRAHRKVRREPEI